ncbi:MAG: antibiotic biosynthesis monooxygenase [Ilumatobacteraceae bacterium]
MNTTTASRTKGNHTVIAIIGHVDVDPTERDRLVAATADLQKATQDDEPGCVVYTISADPVDPGRIRIVELWEDAATLDAHFEHPNFFATGDVLRQVERLGGSAVKYRIDAVAPVKGADGKATTAF